MLSDESTEGGLGAAVEMVVIDREKLRQSRPLARVAEARGEPAPRRLAE